MRGRPERRRARHTEPTMDRVAAPFTFRIVHAQPAHTRSISRSLQCNDLEIDLVSGLLSELGERESRARSRFACLLINRSFGCLQVLFPIRICGSLNVRFWPSIFRLPPSHFSALEVVFPSFSAFSCVYPGVIRRPLSLQCG